MTTNHETHKNHGHAHGTDCGHRAVRHGGHIDYLHDGHLHSAHEGHVDEHSLEVSATNPDRCTSDHACASHDQGHQHGDGCGHEALPHQGHSDYVVEGHLHHAHGTHCDDHGKVSFA